MTKELTNASLSSKRNRQQSVEPLVKNYEEFLDALYDDMEFIVSQFSRSKDKYTQGMKDNSSQGENLINTQICSMLRCRGWSADHDTHINGSADIVVTIPYTDYQWLGEGKVKKSSYKKLYGGLKQLLYRYSTGITDQTSGGVIIYIAGTNDSQISILEKWKKIVSENEYDEDEDDEHLPYSPALKIENCPKSNLVFYSYHEHTSSGLPYVVRHMLIDFRHDPKDA